MQTGGIGTDFSPLHAVGDGAGAGFIFCGSFGIAAVGWGWGARQRRSGRARCMNDHIQTNCHAQSTATCAHKSMFSLCGGNLGPGLSFWRPLESGGPLGGV